MIPMESNSSGAAGLIERAQYLFDLFRMRWRGRGKFDNQPSLDRLAEYQTIAAKHGINLMEAQILEVGFGQRPYLGITLYGLGYDYRGIDLDMPIFPPNFRKVWRLYRANGALRLLKTLVRFYLFDRHEYTKLFSGLGLTHKQVARSKIFVQANAADVDFDRLLASKRAKKLSAPPLVVVSESVFEHVPRRDLVHILDNLNGFASASERKILILTRPTIFTGICGSHLTEWYHHAVYSKKPKRAQPWEHLRLNRFVADTYLNKLSLAEFRKLFEDRGYYIACETVKHPGMGAIFLQDSLVRAELVDWSEEELLSNDVMFELLSII